MAELIPSVVQDDVRLVPVALGEEAAVDLCACGVELAARGERAPRRHQRQIEAVRRGALDRPVEMVPEIIFARPRRIAPRGDVWMRRIAAVERGRAVTADRKSTRLNSSH